MNLRNWTSATVLGLALVLASAMPAAAGDGDSAIVWVGHGVTGQDLNLDPMLPVDVLVADSICALQEFKFGEFAGPLFLDAGTYNIKISVANPDDPCSNDPVINADVPFAAGETATVIAHYDENGGLTASKFETDISQTDPGKGRLVAQHTAAAPTVVVELFRGKPMSPVVSIPGFSNGGQVAAELQPGNWAVTIGPTSDVVLFGPAPFRLKPFTASFVYAVGNLTNGSFTLIANTIPTKLTGNGTPGGEVEDDEEEDLGPLRRLFRGRR